MKLEMPGYGHLKNENKNIAETPKMDEREEHTIYIASLLQLKN